MASDLIGFSRAYDRPASTARFLDENSACQLLPVDRAFQSSCVATLAEAEDLLDRLDACGFGERELRIIGSSFEVRWR
ncbi:MAG: hypothetical protein K2W96_27590 [Gemmataceae bacterium]|nr:hypothetical protein [Gemmataceae bacterium]